ncbi:hypothetical protein V490_08028 [Pseudogymnoascus sp. VKM F-3557]|nr:hypothetical protein V490_08028 [Pseudogymnoascus sp. VKM F-3557]
MPAALHKPLLLDHHSPTDARIKSASQVAGPAFFEPGPVRAGALAGSRALSKQQKLADSSFFRFSELPLEIRQQIWQLAGLGLWVVEVEVKKPDGQWRLERKGAIRPSSLSLLLACDESRQQCLEAYERSSTTTGKEPIRFDWDVLYLKSLNFSDEFTRPNFLEMIQRWNPIDDLDYGIADRSNKWDGRPDNLDMVRTLAIHRDTLTQTGDDYECVLRHFFPRLQLLMVLIDDDVAIKTAWGVKDNDFRPFAVVSEKNKHYEMYVEMEIEKRLKREEQDYKQYTAPVLRVMGCQLPVCGRYPQLLDNLQDIFPNIFELGSNEWFLPTKDGNFLKIKMNYDDPTIRTSDLDTQTASPSALIAFMDQFHNLRSRWRSNTCEEDTEKVINICVEVQKDIINSQAVSEETTLIAHAIRLVALLHDVQEVISNHLPVASMEQFSKVTNEQFSTSAMEHTSDKKNPAIKLSRCNDANNPPNSKYANRNTLTLMIRDVVRVTKQLITGGDAANSPSLFCVLCLFSLIHYQLRPGVVEYLDTMPGEEEFLDVWEELCESYSGSPNCWHPLRPDWNVDEFGTIAGSLARHMESFHGLWISQGISRGGKDMPFAKKIAKFCLPEPVDFDGDDGDDGGIEDDEDDDK